LLNTRDQVLSAMTFIQNCQSSQLKAVDSFIWCSPQPNNSHLFSLIAASPCVSRASRVQPYAPYLPLSDDEELSWSAPLHVMRPIHTTRPCRCDEHVATTISAPCCRSFVFFPSSAF
jgi:hypothetical protein